MLEESDRPSRAAGREKVQSDFGFAELGVDLDVSDLDVSDFDDCDFDDSDLELELEDESDFDSDELPFDSDSERSALRLSVL